MYALYHDAVLKVAAMRRSPTPMESRLSAISDKSSMFRNLFSDSGLAPILNKSSSRNTTRMSSTLSPEQQGLSEEEIAVCTEAFLLFDTNKDGRITATDLGAVMRQLGQSPTEDQLQDIFNEINPDGSGEIELSTFLVMMSSIYRDLTTSDDVIRELFRLFDSDQDGFVSSDDLKHFMKSFGKTLTDEEADEMIREADTDNDNRVSYDEFVYAMRNKRSKFQHKFEDGEDSEMDERPASSLFG